MANYWPLVLLLRPSHHFSFIRLGQPRCNVLVSCFLLLASSQLICCETSFQTSFQAQAAKMTTLLAWSNCRSSALRTTTWLIDSSQTPLATIIIGLAACLSVVALVFVVTVLFSHSQTRVSLETFSIFQIKCNRSEVMHNNGVDLSAWVKLWLCKALLVLRNRVVYPSSLNKWAWEGWIKRGVTGNNNNRWQSWFNLLHLDVWCSTRKQVFKWSSVAIKTIIRKRKKSTRVREG